MTIDTTYLDADADYVKPARLAINDMADWINESGLATVTQYGAIGDGLTDCLTAFQTALAAADRIIVPAGSYRIPFTLGSSLAPAAGQVLEGDGADNTTITLVVPSTAYFACINPSGNGIVFRNLKILLEVPAGGSAVMLIGDVSGVTFENCDIDGAVTNSGASISHEAYLVNFPSSGTQTDYAVRGCDVHRFTFPVLKANASTSAQSRLSFEHCDFFGNYYEDLSFNSPNGSMDDVQVYMCRFRDGSGASASLSQIYVAFASVTNFRVGGCSFSGAIGVGGAAVHLEENCVGGAITGNTMHVQGYGVSMNGNDRASGGAITQPSHITVVGNTIRKYGAQGESGSFGIACIHNPDLDPAAKNIIVANNGITGYATGIYSVLTLDDSSLIRGNHVENCTVGMDFKDGSCTVSGNTTANCTTGVKGSASTATTDSAAIDDHTFINCTTNVDATELPVTLFNPRFIFAEFDHAGGSTSVYKLCAPMGANDRLHGFLEINVDSDNSSSYSRQRDEVTWDGTTFTKADKFAIEPGAIATNAANNSSALAVQVFSSAARTGVRVQAKLNGMAVVAV